MLSESSISKTVSKVKRKEKSMSSVKLKRGATVEEERVSLALLGGAAL
jgi:hypothetical protein